MPTKRTITVPACLRPPKDRTARLFYWFLLITIAVLTWYLISAQKPWNPKLLESIKKREDAGKIWKVEHYIAVLGWAGAAINLLLFSSLLLTLRLWIKPLETPEELTRTPQPRWFFLALTAAVVLGGFFRVQRLDHSLWSDEEYSLRTHIWGQMNENPDGSLTFEPVPWRETFFRNKLNNHLGYTIPTRLIHDTWVKFAATAERPFNEQILRLLPLLASLGSIALIGILTARYANPITGIAAAVFLALNPWHLRYSVEARGYSQMIFFFLLAFIFLIPALRTGRWRHWIAYAFCELMILLCIPGAVFALIIATILATLVIFFSKAHTLQNRFIIAGRMLVVNLIAGGIFLQMIAPSIPQIIDYLAHGTLVGKMPPSWWHEVSTLFSTGLPAHDISHGSHLGSSLASESQSFPGLLLFHEIAIPLLMIIGLFSALIRRSWLLIPAASVILGAILAFTENVISGNTMHSWYVLFILIGLSLLVILGVEALGIAASCLLPKTRRTSSLPLTASAFTLTIFLGVYALSSMKGRSLLCEHPRHPLREVVASVRGNTAYSPADQQIITGSFGPSKGMIKSYDPRNRDLDNPQELMALIEQAKKTNKQLIIYHCGIVFARQDEPEMTSIIEDPTLFKEILPGVMGLEELFSYHVYRYVGP